MFREAPQRDQIEQLVRAASRCPAPSRGLRERVIGEAAHARVVAARRARRGQTGILFGLVTIAIFCVASQWTLPRVHPEAAVMSALIGNIEDPFGERPAVSVSSVTRGADSTEWNQIKSAARVRRWKLRTLRSVFGS